MDVGSQELGHKSGTNHFPFLKVFTQKKPVLKTFTDGVLNDNSNFQNQNFQTEMFQVKKKEERPKLHVSFHNILVCLLFVFWVQFSDSTV